MYLLVPSQFLSLLVKLHSRSQNSSALPGCVPSNSVQRLREVMSVPSCAASELENGRVLASAIVAPMGPTFQTVRE